MLVILPMMLLLFVIGLAYEVFKILVTIFLAGSVVLFIAFAILLYILNKKNFFTRYEDGWKRILSKLLKIVMICEMIGNVCCFCICLFLKLQMIV